MGPTQQGGDREEHEDRSANAGSTGDLSNLSSGLVIHDPRHADYPVGLAPRTYDRPDVDWAWRHLPATDYVERATSLDSLLQTMNRKPTHIYSFTGDRWGKLVNILCQSFDVGADFVPETLHQLDDMDRAFGVRTAPIAMTEAGMFSNVPDAIDDHSQRPITDYSAIRGRPLKELLFRVETYDSEAWPIDAKDILGSGASFLLLLRQNKWRLGIELMPQSPAALTDPGFWKFYHSAAAEGFPVRISNQTREGLLYRYDQRAISGQSVPFFPQLEGEKRIEYQPDYVEMTVTSASHNIMLDSEIRLESPEGHLRIIVERGKLQEASFAGQDIALTKERMELIIEACRLLPPGEKVLIDKRFEDPLPAPPFARASNNRMILKLIKEELASSKVVNPDTGEENKTATKKYKKLLRQFEGGFAFQIDYPAVASTLQELENSGKGARLSEHQLDLVGTCLLFNLVTSLRVGTLGNLHDLKHVVPYLGGQRIAAIEDAVDKLRLYVDLIPSDTVRFVLNCNQQGYISSHVHKAKGLADYDERMAVHHLIDYVTGAASIEQLNALRDASYTGEMIGMGKSYLLAPRQGLYLTRLINHIQEAVPALQVTRDTIDDILTYGETLLLMRGEATQMHLVQQEEPAIIITGLLQGMIGLPLMDLQKKLVDQGAVDSLAKLPPPPQNEKLN